MTTAITPAKKKSKWAGWVVPIVLTLGGFARGMGHPLPAITDAHDIRGTAFFVAYNEFCEKQSDAYVRAINADVARINATTFAVARKEFDDWARADRMDFCMKQKPAFDQGTAKIRAAGIAID